MPRVEGARAPVRAILIAVAATVIGLALFAGPAEAANRAFLFEIAGAPADAEHPGPFSAVSHVTVDDQDNILVLNREFGVTKFSPSGQFILQADGDGNWEQDGRLFGVSYGVTNHRIYMAGTEDSDVYIVGDDGQFQTIYEGGPENWGHHCCWPQVAVDNTGRVNDGDLYVLANTGLFKLDRLGNTMKFGAAGEYVVDSTHIVGNPKGLWAGCCGVGIAIGTNGHVFVAEQANRAVEEFDESGEYVEELHRNAARSIRRCRCRRG